jgi:hypothetical protein
MAAWLATTAGACLIVGFVYYWFGVGRAEKKYAEDFDSVFEAYAQLQRERDALVRLTNQLIDEAGVLTPAERATFDRIAGQLERLA